MLIMFSMMIIMILIIIIIIIIIIMFSIIIISSSSRYLSTPHDGPTVSKPNRRRLRMLDDTTIAEQDAIVVLRETKGVPRKGV